MKSQRPEVHSPESLRALVRDLLCEPDALDPDRYPMTESQLLRRGEPCGLIFCLRGPRSVRLTAIWSSDEQMLYCYNSRGERFAKRAIRLDSEAPRQAA